MFAALMIGHHFSISAFWKARSASGVSASHGIALVSVSDAWMSGRSAYYVEMIANAGLVAIHTAASSRLVAPPGGAGAVLGTNPWSTVRPPGSRTGSVRACKVLRPRQVAQALALALLDILPSTTQTASAPGISFLSRLTPLPAVWRAVTRLESGCRGGRLQLL
jgi:hypothetical protein